MASVIKVLLERRCFPAFRSPVFDTTSPGVGGRLKPRSARHGNLTPPRISPSCHHENGGQEYHDCLTGSLRNSLSSCFVDGWVPLAALHWPSFMRETAQAGLGASSSVAVRLLALRQGTYFSCRMRPSGPGVFQGAESGYKTTPSLLIQIREGVENHKFLSLHQTI